MDPQGRDLAPHPVVGLVLQVGDAKKFPQALGFESLDPFFHSQQAGSIVKFPVTRTGGIKHFEETCLKQRTPIEAMGNKTERGGTGGRKTETYQRKTNRLEETDRQKDRGSLWPSTMCQGLDSDKLVHNYLILGL